MREGDGGGGCLERLVEIARNYVMTPAEISEQRVSFVWGQMNGAWSKDRVRDHLVSRGESLPRTGPP